MIFDSSQLDSIDGICFVTDATGLITAIGAKRWHAFAAANKAPGLSTEAIVGRNLFEFVLGQENELHLRSVLRRLSSGLHDAWVMPFRCDAPDRRRNMRQSVTPFLENGRCHGFLFQSIELSREDRPPIELFDFQAMQARAAQRADMPMVWMCSWCQRVKHPVVTASLWLQADSYYAAGGRSDVQLTHGICEQCRDVVESSFTDAPLTPPRSPSK